MRAIFACLSYASLFSSVAASKYKLKPRHDANLTAAAELPQCALECGSRISMAFDCPITEPCFCETSGPKIDATVACLKKSCDMRGSLASQRFQAETCGFPYRDKSWRIALVSYILYGIAMVFVVARFISRFPRLLGAGFGADDWTVGLCVAPMTGMTVAAYYEYHYGSGRDVWTVPVDNLEPFALWFFVGQPLYVMVTYLSKLSLVFLYLRIWREESMSSFRITCWIVATSLIMCTIGCVLACIFPCQPISYAWRQVLPGVTGKCSNRTAAAFAFSGINIAYDVIVLLIPIPRFIGLSIPLHKKIGVCSCFLVGFAVTACSIIRLTHLVALTDSRNPPWDFAEPGFWSLIEVYTCMICCCTPAMAGFLHRLYKYGFEGRWESFKSSMLSSRRSDSQLVWHPEASGNDPQRNCQRDDVLVDERGHVVLDENGRVIRRSRIGRNPTHQYSSSERVPDDMLHVEKALSHHSPEKARFASLDGTTSMDEYEKIDDRERPLQGIARIPSDANMMETVLQHPGAGQPIMRMSSEEEEQVLFEARRSQMPQGRGQ
ncbi:hypothetical protein CBER1_00129 [Cercospora berteroae]|uniref:Rhodopsin domain-containing protein n=1 Tax=Cercospora berteroae TaxID=357750 RepID=A0A2S6CD66_9PEZI|nr:hypothetical protein CBER1_00129 [Cercospora berteroae]